MCARERVCVMLVKIINCINLLTARPPISLYLRDSHCAIAQRPRAATFSAYNYLMKGAHHIVKYPHCKVSILTSTVPSGKLNLF